MDAKKRMLKRRYARGESFSPRYYFRLQYNEALFLAEYYRWLAQKGFELFGRDPLTGKSQPGRLANRTEVKAREGVAARKALARFWIAEAGRLRERGTI